MKQIAIILLSAALITGCATTGEQNGRLGGAAVGAGLGAVLGNAADCQGCALIGAVLGGLAGGYTGGEVGRRMDEHDARMANRSLEYNRTGTTTTWNNPDTQTTYDATPVRTYNQSGRFCREMNIGHRKGRGKREEMYGTFCRNPDGSWVLQQ